MKRKTDTPRRIAAAVHLTVLFVAILCYTSAMWYVDTYGQIGFDSVLYTLTSNLGGVEKGLIFNYVKNALVYTVVLWAVLSFVLFFSSRKQLVMTLFGKKKRKLYPLPTALSCIAVLVISAVLLVKAAQGVELDEYIDSVRNPSTFFQENYADPMEVKITFPEKKRNLVYIFLESMETSYFSEAEGGALKENVIPELYTLARDNLNFSHNMDVGGFYSTSGTTWTIGAMVGHTSGLPLKKLPGQDENELGESGAILPGAAVLSDVLKENGYYQCLMMGSEAEFGGRYQYFMAHNMDEICDYHAAVKDGIIPKDYYVWWGMEDEYLFQYAKQELTEIAKREEPFAFSLLTVDTHRVEGYVCRLCGNTYSERYENVCACSSRQVAEFVQWLQQQDFYENTTIILAGDHLTMAGDYVGRAIPAGYDRRVYNCFVNPAVTTDNTKNRGFCALDLFPTTLAAMGCSIEGERLGLGTNLFSDRPTMIEEMGIDRFQQETAAFSEYYFEKFVN